MILPSLSFNKDEECDIWIIINIHISNLGMLIIIIIIFCKQSFTTFRKSLSHILKTKISNYTFERLKLWFRHKIRVPSADIFGFIFFFFWTFLIVTIARIVLVFIFDLLYNISKNSLFRRICTPPSLNTEYVISATLRFGHI